MDFMGYGITGVLCYVDENGNAVVVSADNPLPATVNGEYPHVFTTEIASK